MAKAGIGRPALAQDIALLPSVAVVARAIAVSFDTIAARTVCGACPAVVEPSFRTPQNAELAVDAGCTLRTRTAGPEPVGCVVLANALCQVHRVVVHANTFTGAKKAP